MTKKIFYNAERAVCAARKMEEEEYAELKLYAGVLTTGLLEDAPRDEEFIAKVGTGKLPERIPAYVVMQGPNIYGIFAFWGGRR